MAAKHTLSPVMPNISSESSCLRFCVSHPPPFSNPTLSLWHRRAMVLLEVGAYTIVVPPHKVCGESAIGMASATRFPFWFADYHDDTSRVRTVVPSGDGKPVQSVGAARMAPDLLSESVLRQSRRVVFACLCLRVLAFAGAPFNRQQGTDW